MEKNLLTIAAKEVVSKLGDNFNKTPGLKIWYTAWAATSAYAIKPVFDDIFDMMHPKDSLPSCNPHLPDPASFKAKLTNIRLKPAGEIGRASCRERVCQYV